MSEEVKSLPNWTKFWSWFTAHSFRWNKLAVAVILFLIFKTMTGTALVPDESPPEVWWFAAGAIITGLVGWMLAPDPSKSEVLTLAEKVIDKANK